MKKSISAEALDQLFHTARTYNDFENQDVPDTKLHDIYDIMKMGPTSTNSCPVRILFLKSKEAKEKLRPALSPGNQDKTMRAPVVALIAHDLEFHEKLPFLSPHNDARSWFAGESNRTGREEAAFRNGTLQGAYFIIAARALGLDCGPMSGFDADVVNNLFFQDTHHRINFICNLGHGIEESVYPRAPRLPFDEACKII